MTSYLDSVPQNPSVGGAGISSYANNIGGSAPAAEVYSAPAQASGASAFTSTPPSGAGIASYLDTVPQNPAVGGAGISSYSNNIGGSAPAAEAYYAPAQASG